VLLQHTRLPFLRRREAVGLGDLPHIEQASLLLLCHDKPIEVFTVSELLRPMPLLGEFHHGGLSNIDRRQFPARMQIRLADISRNLHRKRSGLPWKVLYFAT